MFYAEKIDRAFFNNHKNKSIKKMILITVCLQLEVKIKLNLICPIENLDVQHLIWHMLHVVDTMDFSKNFNLWDVWQE